MPRSPEYRRFAKRVRAEGYLRDYRTGRVGFFRTLYRILSLKVRRV